jgi:hypothetical protein
LLIAVLLISRLLFTPEVSIIEAEKMELLAILVLGVVTFVSFSTNERKPKTKTDRRANSDPDWAFTQSGDLDGSRDKEEEGSSKNAV